MREGWKSQSIGSMCKVVSSGGTPNRKIKEYYEKGNIKWLKTKELSDSSIYDTEEYITDLGLKESSAKLYPRNTVVMAMYGATVGKLGILKNEMSTNQACCCMVVNQDEVDYEFLFYSLLYHRDSLINLANGAAQQNLNANIIKNFEINVPPLKTQKKIARILSSLDDKIELNRQMNCTLEAMAQVIFKSWFVDFDPVHAKAAAKNDADLDIAAKKLGISREILDLFPDKFMESEIGLVPEGWEVKPLKSIINVNPKYSLKKGTVAKYIELKMLSTTQLSINGYLNREFKGSGSKFMNGDTILVRITPSLENGKRGFVDLLSENEVAWGSTEYIILRGKYNNLREWVYMLSISDTFRNFAIVNMNGSSGRQRVPREAVEDYLLPIPQNNLLDIFSKQARVMFNQIKINTQEIQALQKTRDTLLPKLLSGELDVSEIEI